MAKEEQSKHSTIKWAGVTLLIIGPFYETLKVGEALPFLIAGCALMIMSRFDKITEFELFGAIKAKLEAAISDAQATIEQLRAVAKGSARAGLAAAARSGHISGIPDHEREEILHETVKALQEVGFSKKDIEAITKDFHDTRLMSFAGKLISPIPGHAGKECSDARTKLHEISRTRPITAQELKQFFEECHLTSPNLAKRINDYDHYYQTRQWLDFDDFVKRREWESLEYNGPKN